MQLVRYLVSTCPGEPLPFAPLKSLPKNCCHFSLPGYSFSELSASHAIFQPAIPAQQQIHQFRRVSYSLIVELFLKRVVALRSPYWNVVYHSTLDSRYSLYSPLHFSYILRSCTFQRLYRVYLQFVNEKRFSFAITWERVDFGRQMF